MLPFLGWLFHSFSTFSCRSVETAFCVLLSEDAKIPKRATNGSAGYDIYSPVECVIPPRTTVKINLGIAVKPPLGCYARTSCRSSLATKHELMCPADVIDPDYTGTIHMCLTNQSSKDYAVSKHERIGSIVFERIALNVEWKTVKSLRKTDRDSKGFGSTGEF